MIYGKLIGGLIGLALALLLIYYPQNLQINGDEVDCYDEYRNRIIGQKCIVEKGYSSERHASLALASLGGAIIFIGTVFGHLIDITFGKGGI